MTAFLFAKQLVDMLYQFHTLDYIMVILVFLMLIYQMVLVRPNIRKRTTITDIIIILLGICLTTTLIRSGSGYQIYFKVMSAFLVYFMGRIYYDRIRECCGTLAIAAYLIIYLNLLHRIINFGLLLLQVKNANGDLYYYDTDMAFAIILAMVFIAMFGKNSVIKIVTIFIVCPYMVFYSDAGIQMTLMLAVYAILAIYVIELVMNKKKLSAVLLTTMIVGLLVIVLIIYLPILGIDNQSLALKLFQGNFLNFNSMNSRYADWGRVLEQCKDQGIVAAILGTGMGAEISVRSLYIKIFYSLGYLGLVFALLLVVSIMYYATRVEDRKTFYLAVIMAVLLLGSGVTVDSIESTQMSWFPLLFAGMVISSVQVEGEKADEEERC